MKRIMNISLAFATFFVVGCSAATTRTQTQTPHQHVVVNTIRPGNAHGNSLILPEPYRGIEPEAPRTTVASHVTEATTAQSDWLNDSMPFSSQYDSSASSQFGVASDTATPEQVLGLESNNSSSVGSAEDSELSVATEISDTSSTEDTNTWDSSSSQPVNNEDSSGSVNIPAAPATYHDTSSSWSDYEEPEPMRSSQVTTDQVYRAVQELRGLSTWEVVPFAHFRRELRHVVVAWPAINSAGQVVDATVVGACLEEAANGSLEQCGQRWVVSDRSASIAALEAALGGSD